MKLEFEDRQRTGRFVVRDGSGRMLFETYNLTSYERVTLRLLIESVRDVAYDEGMTCQQALALTAAIRSSRAPKDAAPPPPSASTPQVSPSVQAGNRSGHVEAGAVGDERKDR